MPNIFSNDSAFYKVKCISALGTSTGGAQAALRLDSGLMSYVVAQGMIEMRSPVYTIAEPVDVERGWSSREVRDAQMRRK